MDRTKERKVNVQGAVVSLHLTRCFKQDMPALRANIQKGKRIFNNDGKLQFIAVKKETVTGFLTQGNQVVYRFTKVVRGRKHSVLLGFKDTGEACDFAILNKMNYLPYDPRVQAAL